MTEQDQALEQQIEAAYQDLLRAPAEELTMRFARMRDLVACRSPEQIERMERERGLRA